MVVFWVAMEARARNIQKQVTTAEETLRQYQAIVDQINEIEKKLKV